MHSNNINSDNWKNSNIPHIKHAKYEVVCTVQPNPNHMNYIKKSYELYKNM